MRISAIRGFFAMPGMSHQENESASRTKLISQKIIL
jgi:hypothetical protein